MDSRHKKKSGRKTTTDETKQIAGNDKLQRKLGVRVVEHKKKTKVKDTKKGKRHRTPRSRNYTVSGPGFNIEHQVASASPPPSTTSNNKDGSSFSPQPRRLRRRRGKSTATALDLQALKPRSVE